MENGTYNTTQKIMTPDEKVEYWKKQVELWDGLRYIVKNWGKHKRA
jgi:hypothetical protein